MKNSVRNACRYFILAILIIANGRPSIAQITCIQTVATACVGDCVDVTYIGAKPPTADYQWSISCGTITNPTLQNPHSACFQTAGNCTIQVIVTEMGTPPETCTVDVRVNPLPTGTLTLSTDSICLGDCLTLNIHFTGVPPFNFEINANNNIGTFKSDFVDFSMQVCPRFSSTFSLQNLTDQNCSNANPNSNATVVVLPAFTGSVTQINNMLCAAPSNISYAWYACNGNILLSTQQCFSPTQNGCYCVALDNGLCKDTVCKEFSCNLTCSFDFPNTILIGDTALIHYTGNGGVNTTFDWTIFSGNLFGTHYTGNDSLYIRYDLPGCFPINLTVREANCIVSCTDTICVIAKACTCDTFTKNSVTPIPGTCCYDVSGKIASLNCFTKMQVLLSAGSFNNVRADALAGWSFQTTGNNEINYTHSSGFIPPGSFHAGAFCVTGANNYTITVRYLKATPGNADSCTYQYVFNCPPVPKCDSLVSYLEKQHTLPAFCCFNIQANNPYANLYDKVKVVLSSGTFSSFTANSSQGFFLIPGGTQDFSLGHNSGFLPTGQTLPGSFCIGSGLNPITVNIIYYYNGDSCTYQYLFDCPGFNNQPNCCDSTTLQLVPIGIQPNCCYDVQGNSKKSACYTRICFKTSTGSFTNVAANPGWTASVTPQGFCFIPVSPFIPTGPINPGAFCISGGTNPITISADYYDANGMILDSCKKTFQKNCPPPPKTCSCDSLKNQLNSVSVNPGLCCYAIQGTVPSSNCYTQIVLQLSAGNFSNIITSTNWSSFSSGGQKFSLSHNSGFVPAGTINPANFCVANATNYTIWVHYLFNNNGKIDTCSFNYTFSCPAQPKPCSCDSLINSVNQASVNPGLCCYDLEGNVPKANCYTQIQVTINSGVFSNIQDNTGWSHVSNSGQSFTLTHNSGFVPSGIVIPASFCVTGSTFYTITVVYLYNNNGIKTCVFNYTFDCPAPPKPCSCDSLINSVTQTSNAPGVCCYKMQGNVPTSGCFTQIQVLVNSGGFVNIQDGTGWSHVSNGVQSFTLSHSSGFVPAGSINPANYCVSGTNLYTITVHYFFTNNGVKDTCTYKYTFDCPSVPKSCSCDSLKSTLNQASVTPGLCCYDLEAEVPSSNCFTKIQVVLSSGSFTNIQDSPNWSHTSNGAQSFTLSHSSGYLPQGTIVPASFCVSGSTFYMITVNYIINSNGVKDTCTYKYTFDCPNISKPCNCDSLLNTINQSSANPGLCCYNLQGNVPVNNCFTQIDIFLNSGSFTNIQNGNGWNFNSNGPQNISLNHTSGFIPSGIINPVSFCVTGASFYMITVNYYFNNNGIKDTCRFNYAFDCPVVADSLCDQGSCASGNKAWQVIAGSVNTVYDMVVYQCKLIVAGQFNQVGSTPANNIAAWDGTNWTTLAQGVNGTVRALAVHNGLLYVGGQFSIAGTTVNVNNIASWNGTAWSHLDNGVTGSGSVFVGSLLSTANGLVVGGSFQNAGLSSSLATNNIARWNGSSWNSNFNSLSNVFNGPIYSLREYGGQLYAAGTFSTPHKNTTHWNGSVWLANGTGINLVNNVPYNGVAAQYVFGGKLIVGGHYLNANNLLNTQHIANWNGTSWAAMTGGDLPDTIDAVHDFIRYNGRLYAGGAINKMGSTLLKGVGEWNGTSWLSTNHPNQIIWALEAYDSCGTIACDLYSAGEGFVNRWVCLTTTENESSSEDFILQPNPAGDIINVLFNKSIASVANTLKLMNMQGKLISVYQNIQQESVELDISRLSPGVYIMEYAAGKNKPSRKMFVKI
jgi:hypothetical protein